MLTAIIDYSSGNLHSAQKAFENIAAAKNLGSVVVTKDPTIISTADRLVLPGDGAFPACKSELMSSKVYEALIYAAVEKARPFLGICVGMQMLANMSEENGVHEGLGWIDGKIKILPGDNLKLPHMGWNLVSPTNSQDNNLISDKNDYYFVHSYYFDCPKKDNILAETKYGINFASIVGKENIYGVQFHPEKSSSQGLNLLKEFIRL